jgi:antitoxin component YwqK of YwqJK toxin-antitoxin module
MKTYYFFLISILIYSCSERIITKNDYYDNGELRQVNFFKKNEIHPYKIVSFYKGGTVKDTNYYNNEGKLHGVSYYFDLQKKYFRYKTFQEGKAEGLMKMVLDDGSIWIRHFKNDTLFGIEKRYDISGGLSREVLWINDEALAYKMYNQIQTGDTISYFVTMVNGKMKNGIDVCKYPFILKSFYKKDFYSSDKEAFTLLGSLRINQYNEVINTEMNNSYVHAKLKNDTVSINDSLVIELSHYYGRQSNIHFKMVFGDFNSNLEIIDNENKQEYLTSVGETAWTFEILNPAPGYNLVLGKVYVIQNTKLIDELLIFEDYYIVDTLRIDDSM